MAGPWRLIVFVRRTVARVVIVLACLLGAVVSAAHAQPAGGTPPPPHAKAPRDTTVFLPPWMHPWVEIGGGWLASPKYMRSFYESGQGFSAGLSARVKPRLDLRLSGDYQMLVSHHTGRTVIDWGYLDQQGQEVVDTLTYDFDSNASMMQLRGETGVGVGHGLWFTGGLGAGYMHGGFQDESNIPGSGFKTAVPAAMRNGWGWSWTAAARWDLDLDPMVPLGLELRTTSLKRGPTFVHWYAVRLSYRIPDVARKAGRRP